MKHVDMRKLPAAAQEERRRQVIGLRQAGQTYDAIAAQVGLSPTGVFNICQRYAEQGAAGLKTGPRGPEPGYGRFLDAEEEAETRDLIRRHTPDELDLPFALWSRAAVRELIWQRFGVRLAVRTMGSYLARWGFTAQKPLRRAYEQDPAAVRRWQRRDYPAIADRAKAEGGPSSGVTRPAISPTFDGARDGGGAASTNMAGPAITRGLRRARVRRFFRAC
jgi:transposase